MPDDPVLALLNLRLLPPIPEDILRLAGIALELTRAQQADRLVTIPAGPALPAGAVVEILGLDELV